MCPQRSLILQRSTSSLIHPWLLSYVKLKCFSLRLCPSGLAVGQIHVLLRFFGRVGRKLNKVIVVLKLRLSAVYYCMVGILPLSSVSTLWRMQPFCLNGGMKLLELVNRHIKQVPAGVVLWGLGLATLWLVNRTVQCEL